MFKTCVLVIIIAALYALTKTISGLSAKLSALQKEHADMSVAVRELGDKVSVLQTQLEDQSKNAGMVAFSARIKPSYTDIEPWATIIFADVVTNVGNSYSGTSGQ